MPLVKSANSKNPASITAHGSGSLSLSLSFDFPAQDTLQIRLAGSWKITNQLPSIQEIANQIRSGTRVKKVTFDTVALEGWDSGLVTFLLKVFDVCAKAGIEALRDGLPSGIKELLKLATAVPEKKGARREAVQEPVLARIGSQVISFRHTAGEMLEFIGEASLAFGKLIAGKACFQRSDFLSIVQKCGIESLPIVSLISMLVGLIFAFVGAVQLTMFGAQIYVASLVGIAMVRVMGAIMTGIIMAGRTGAAFAAEIGTMQVNEEIDALKTLGISPMEFLVLPRMLALTLMMPLLCLYADLMGILGGLIVGVGMLKLNVIEYYNQTQYAVTLTYMWIGLFHSAVFGVLVALSGCLRGMQCGRSASAVGNATTSAVVTSIVAIIVATAIITVICNVIGI
jgi:phospholipid/cholesterol/gamma-HCH transport system permease protein